ncbi:MAG: hypothetical protein KC546_02655 [Anaerolineae bacterium]|nr:hypothetical protein [Anaerolineae bacterium]
MMKCQIVFPKNNISNPSPTFVEAIREDSNREIEWLWYAAKMQSLAEKEYCLRRALYINPLSAATLHELRRLARKRTQKPEFVKPQPLIMRVILRLASII